MPEGTSPSADPAPVGGDFGRFEPDAPKTWSVGDLATAIGEHVRAGFPNEVWVRGEIHDLSRARSGHVYFRLVDADSAAGTENGQLSVMLTSTARQRVNRLLTRAGGRVRMTDGTEVRIRGRIDFYEARGQLQLRMTSIDPAFTLGQLAAARAALVQQLAAEGLLDANRRRSMPLAPLRIGLVTASGSAAEADVVHELTASGFRFEILAADVRVQGVDAPVEVAAAIGGLGGRDLDALIVARGGGAASDLAAFDSEVVARAIATCPVPVVVGVGHEIDRSVADEVAHTAAKTPTAAAQYVVGLVAAARDRAELAWQSVSQRTAQHLAAATHQLDRNTFRVAAVATAATARASERLDRLGAAVSRTAADLLAEHDRTLHRVAERLTGGADRALERGHDVLQLLAARTDALDPARALERGWSITRLDDGSLLRSVGDAAAGATLHTQLADGTVVSVVLAETEEEP